MKNIVILFVLLFAFTIVYGQTDLIVGAPLSNGSTSSLRAPNGTAAHTSLRGHLIVTAAELTGIPTGTVFNGLGFLYGTGATSIASGTIQLYLENTTDNTNLKSATWTTAISTMTNVYNGLYSIPNVAGPTNIPLTGTFTYSGGSIYVAYSYSASTYATTGAVYLCNNLIAGSVKMEVSATTTPPTTLNQVSGFRPEIEFKFPNPYTNNIAVEGMFAGRGQDNLLLGNTQNVEVRIKNVSSGSLSNVPVALNITGANPFSTSQNVASLAPGASATVNFLGIPQTNQGNQILVASVPADQQTTNDSFTLNQDIFCDTVGYAYGDSITGGLGYNMGAGILASLLVIPSGQAIYIKKVVPTISTGTASVGNVIKGVLLNAAGVIVDSTANHMITAANLGHPVSLTFINGATDYSGDSIYFGFRQVANATTGYFPLATQELNGFVPADLFCGFNAFGGGYANYTQFGVGMISAVLSPSVGSFSLSSNATNGVICAGTQLNLTATAGYPNYIFDIDGSVVQNGTLNSYSYSPSASMTAVVTSNIGQCPYTDSISAVQVSAVTSSISDSYCSGSSYNFNGQVLTSSGIYLDTIVSSAGCDSIITLTLSALSPTSSTITESLCANSFQFGGEVVSASGIYFDTIPNSSGCDSVITLNLTLNAPVNVTVQQTGANLMASPTPISATLQWIDCSTNTIIAGANDSIFVPSLLVGSYAVVAFGIGGCNDTSTCITIDQTTLDETSLTSTINLYPNPASQVISVNSNEFVILAYSMYDLNGRKLIDKDIKSESKTVHLNVSNFENGMYILKVETTGGTIKRTFVKN